MKENKTNCGKEASYKKPIIPQGFTYLKGTRRTGYTIEKISDGSHFVWIPVGSIEEDGMLHGKKHRFGIRTFFQSEESRLYNYYDLENDEMVESIIKYGGFYFSAYLAAIEDGKIVFKKGLKPLDGFSYEEVENAVKHYSDDTENIVTCLPNGACYDTIFRWFTQMGKKTFEEIAIDSSSWGNYCDSENASKNFTATGSNKKWSVCNIYDIAGNLSEWTAERCGEKYVATRGGCCIDEGRLFPVAQRILAPRDDTHLEDIGFRAMLYLK